MNKRAACACRT